MVSAQPYKIRKLGATIETPPSRTPPAGKHGGKTNRL
ncbi:unnamed protein product [Brassica rapa]|uniref:Uncharacterized protein n=2 Tax=Brassica TaxID=3705 RepID=A0A8D9GKL7_BRACM|nr:unnamed protein product [Brassica napus]CAG7882483.1 unnamed protein product [Brassica rapa]